MKIQNILKDTNLKEIQRWTIFSILIGIVSGFGATLFYFGLNLMNHYVLGGIGGYFPPLPGGETELFNHTDIEMNKWLIFLIIVLGGLISGSLIYTFAPEAEGHGTDAVIDAYNNKRGMIRKRVPIIKTISSIITIGTGGSAGREGPIAQIGAGFGSTLATYLNLSDRDRRIMVICGTAAGIGSIFKAPLGGAIFAIEVLYKSDIESDGLVPAFISSTVAYSIFSSFYGWGHIFITPNFTFTNPIELTFYGILGLICALIAILYVTIFYGLRDNLFKPLKIKPHFKPAIGGILLGIIALVLGYKQVLGTGYGWLQVVMDNDAALPLSLMIILIFMKIVATSFTVSSGGSGGVFAPTLVIGGMLGGAFGRILNIILPSIITQPSSYVLVGMGALLAGVAKVPITSIIMVSEMAGNYNLLAPLMVASTLSYIASDGWTIYEKQAENRASSPAHRREMTVDILERAKVKDAMTTELIVVPPLLSVQGVLDLIHKYGYTGYPVVENKKLIGIITFEDAEKIPHEKRKTTLVKDVMTKDLIVIYPETSLEEALHLLLDRKIGRLLVVDEKDTKKLIGIVSKYDIVRTHAKLSSNFTF